MKLINPIGRKVNKLGTGANFGDIIPKGCICSSGATNLAAGYNCASCACQCDSGTVNRSANFEIADVDVNYVNS